MIADVDESMQRLPGGDLRARPRGDAVRRRGRRDPARQRDALRARRLRVDERHPPRPPRRARDRRRHVLDQLAERARPAHAVRRRQGSRASAARAATTRSTSTARPRSSTSRSARTTSRGWDCADGARRRVSAAGDLVGPGRGAPPSTSCAPPTSSWGSPTSRPRAASTSTSSGLSSVPRTGTRSTSAAGRSAPSLARPPRAARRGLRAACVSRAREADLDGSRGTSRRGLRDALGRGDAPRHRTRVARARPVRLPARVLPRDERSSTRSCSASTYSAARRSAHRPLQPARPATSRQSFRLLAAARLPLHGVHRHRRARRAHHRRLAARKPTVHDVALTVGRGPRLHHLGFAVPDRPACCAPAISSLRRATPA